MSCLNFEYMLVGQVLLDEAACYSAPAFRPSQHKSRSPSYPLHHQDQFNYSSFLSPYNALVCNNLPIYDTDYTNGGHVSRRGALRSASLERTLYPIYEEDEEGDDYDDGGDDDDDDEEGSAFNAPILRLFKSCLVQFAYMIPTDKASKSPPASPRKG